MDMPYQARAAIFDITCRPTAVFRW